MRNRLQLSAPFGIFIVAFVASGCLASEEDIPATAAPTTTGIPMGAPGAVGARTEPPTPIIPYAPRTESTQEKINPGPHPPSTSHGPVVPPSPFGGPTDDDDQTPTPPTKKQKGTKI